MTFDHGVLNVPLDKRGNGSLDAQIDRGLAEIRKAEREQWKADRVAAAEREATRPRFTAADLADATYVHDGYSWARVVRVNAKSVTVESGHSWTERVALDKVRDYRPRAVLSTPP